MHRNIKHKNTKAVCKQLWFHLQVYIYKMSDIPIHIATIHLLRTSS